MNSSGVADRPLDRLLGFFFKEFAMSISSIGSSPVQVYTPPRAPAQAAPKACKDADGDRDGTTSTQAAAYASGSTIDVTG